MECAVCCQEVGHQFARHRDSGFIGIAFLLGLVMDGSQRGVLNWRYLGRFDQRRLQMLIPMFRKWPALDTSSRLP